MLTCRTTLMTASAARWIAARERRAGRPPTLPTQQIGTMLLDTSGTRKAMSRLGASSSINPQKGAMPGMGQTRPEHTTVTDLAGPVRSATCSIAAGTRDGIRRVEMFGQQHRLCRSGLRPQQRLRRASIDLYYWNQIPIFHQRRPSSMASAAFLGWIPAVGEFVDPQLAAPTRLASRKCCCAANVWTLRVRPHQQ